MQAPFVQTHVYGASQALIETFNGNSWSIVPSPNGGTYASDLAAVSCTSPTFCEAVGSYSYLFSTGVTFVVEGALIDTFNGSSWSVTRIPHISTTLEVNAFDGVSCASPGFCAAVGYYYAEGVPRTLIDSFNGSSWALAPSPNVGTVNDALYSVSCPSASFCAASGRYFTPAGTPQTLIEAFNRSSWSITPSPNASTTLNALFGVSCTSQTFCAAVGYYDNTTGTPRTLVESFNGSSWSLTSSPNSAGEWPWDGTSHSNELLSVSCTTPRFCVAVGSYYGVETMAETFNGALWSVSPALNEEITGAYWNQALYGVSATSGDSAIAVGWTAGPAADKALAEAGNGLGKPTSPKTTGYDLVGSDGGVFVFPTGTAGGFYGSLPGLGVKVNDIVGMVPTSTDQGYFLVGSDGGVFAFGNAPFLGSLPGLHVTPTQPITGIVAANTDKGYFLVGRDGGVFAFGTVPFLGSLPGKGVSVDNIIGIASTPSGNGYWLVSATGTIYGFGAAQQLGTAKGTSSPVSAIAGTPTGGGYWITTQNGSVYSFGNATYHGSLPALGVTPALPVIGIAHTADTGGYWLIGADGGIFAFGDAGFVGSLPGLGVNVTDIVGAVPTGD